MHLIGRRKIKGVCADTEVEGKRRFGQESGPQYQMLLRCQEERKETVL